MPGSLLGSVGRGYSDLCAAMCAVGIGARELQIWKEVDGVYTADPSKVTSARFLATITPEEAAELTYFGSEVRENPAPVAHLSRYFILSSLSHFRFPLIGLGNIYPGHSSVDDGAYPKCQYPYEAKECQQSWRSWDRHLSNRLPINTTISRIIRWSFIGISFGDINPGIELHDRQWLFWQRYAASTSTNRCNSQRLDHHHQRALSPRQQISRFLGQNI